MSAQQPREHGPLKVAGIRKHLDRLSVHRGCEPVNQCVLCQVRHIDTDSKPYQRGKLIMVAYKYELFGETQGAKACRQSDLGSFVYYAVIKFPA